LCFLSSAKGMMVSCVKMACIVVRID
jgi:hypothetical protein